MPIEHVLAVLAVEVPVHFAPQLVDAGGEGLLGGRTVDVVLVDGEQGLHDEGCFYQVAAIVFLPERFHFARIAIPPVRVAPWKRSAVSRKETIFSIRSSPSWRVT